MARWFLSAFLSSKPASRSWSYQHNLIPTQLEQVIPLSSQPKMQLNYISLAFIREWLLVEPAEAIVTPTEKNIDLLQEAMSTFYNQPPNYAKAEKLLTKTIEVWKDQPVDELAALYRIRADCFMALQQPNQAKDDYSRTIELLKGPGGDQADPNELPIAYLGRARAIRSSSNAAADQAAKDYQMSLRLSSREEWETDRENEEDGAASNPYATWEWGTSLRNAGNFQEAASIHDLAGKNFESIGDRARSVISQIDAGIDLAIATGNDDGGVLAKAIERSKGVESRDVALLQRVIAKEGEGRMALASVLWSNPSTRPDAENQLGEACLRLDQLEADSIARAKRGEDRIDGKSLKFSIDDQPGAGLSCSRFKNQKFLSDTLQWPLSLQSKMLKLENLENQ